MSENKTLQQHLMEAGVHFGHLRKKWNPKMLPYIFVVLSVESYEEIKREIYTN